MIGGLIGGLVNPIIYKNWKSLLGWPKQFQGFPAFATRSFTADTWPTPWDFLSFFDPMGWNSSPFFATTWESIFWSTFSIRIEFRRKIQALNSSKPQEKTHFVLCRLSQLATIPTTPGFGDLLLPSCWQWEVRGGSWESRASWFWGKLMARWWQLTYAFVIFTPILGDIIQLDEHIFQMGWFNHQPDGMEIQWKFRGKIYPLNIYGVVLPGFPPKKWHASFLGMWLKP